MKENKKIYIVFTILIIIITALSITKEMQNDTFFTIATGNSILNNGYDNLDHLTWHNNLEFYKLRWAFDITIATIYNTFNFIGIYIFIILIACITTVSLFNILIKQKNNIIISFVVAMTSALLLANGWFFTGRAQIISYLLLLWEVHFIERLIDTKQKRYYIILFCISVLIVNFHASVWPMTIILLLPYIAEAIIYKIVKDKNQEKRKFIIEPISLKKLIIAVICIAVGSLISPIGTYVYTYMFKIIGGLSSTFIAELATTNILTSVGMIVGLLIIDVLLLATKTKMKLSDFLLYFGLFFMALLAKRNLAFLYLIGMIAIARLISVFFETYDSDNLLEKANKFFSKNTSLVYVTLAVIIVFSNNAITRYRENYINEKKYPVEAVKYIKENLDYKNLKIYNSFNYGSYLEFQGIPAFLDSRSEIFCKEFNDTEILQDWLDTSRGYKNYNDTFEKYNIDYAIVENGEIINTYLSRDAKYEKIYEDDTYSLYSKKM